MDNNELKVYDPIPLSYSFRPMWCANCGVKLERHKVYNNSYWQKCQGVDNHYFYDYYKGYDIFYMLKCPSCGNVTTYEYQVKIAKRQKKLGKRILRAFEMEDLNE